MANISYLIIIYAELRSVICEDYLTKLLFKTSAKRMVTVAFGPLASIAEEQRFLFG